VQVGVLVIAVASSVAVAGTADAGAEGTPATLCAAIRDLAADFPDQYPAGPDLLRRLETIERRMSSGSAADRRAAQADFAALQREALTAHPLLRRWPILFVVRPQYAPDHHNTGTDFQPGEVSARGFRGGGALKVLDPARGGVRTVFSTATGALRDPDVHFDGQRIVFAMRQDGSDSYHIVEVRADGSGLRQLTRAAPDSDVDPAYLPDDRIVFTSTRDLKYCGCNRHVQGSLFAMESDGANVHQISRNNLFDSRPSVMQDGRILYDRWEYVDTMFGPRFALWTARPDGSQHALFCGNNDWAPGAIFDAREIPGTQQVVAVYGACHDRPWGAMVVLDRRRGLDGMSPVVRSWPPDITRYMANPPGYRLGDNPPGQIDTFAGLPVKYEDPWPLADPAAGRGAGKYFLCSRTTGRGEQMGIFLVDVFGNQVLLHAEEPGCFDPMPLAPRARPPVIPPRVAYARPEGTFYVADVYRGSGMDRLPRGTVKWLRVVEAPAKRNWTGPMWNMDTFQAPAMNFNCTNNKRILGDVPVEADGSAYFDVPADKFVFFQALDSQKMMVQSMRSGTMLMPGEQVGCVGCHEGRLEGTPLHRAGPPPMALRREPSRIEPWYGPPREFNYLTEVQPVFDRHCTSCHDYGKEAGKDLNLSGDLGLVFNTSYLELHRKSARRWFPDPPGAPKLLVKAVHDGPPEVLPPYAWGSHRSRLADVLREDHHGVKIDRSGFERIVTWIDLNTPYYGSYYSVYRDNVYGRAPLNDRQLARLAELTGLPYRNPQDHVNLNHQAIPGTELAGSQVSFTRPELSPCLAGLDPKGPRYQEALAIIRAGKEQLDRLPREDMLGPAAQPVAEVEGQRCARCELRVAAEGRTRQAILAGTRSHEKPPGNHP
jgi:hypothetical protein